MHIKRLRLSGFKSFVEPTELLIEAGLTGVVGPNGCGKSNLLEALRWVMGETSHKSMRAAAMDDVIFSGTMTRPARNHAEVSILIDNSERRAPPELNDIDVIEVTRRIEREMGSIYKVSGRDVRARDVKLLFEDAATGARSPALVRQGQIAEIVNAKPEQRRRILEDAAGIAGLHSRRHEAELRLKAADVNLARVSDILGQLTTQIAALKRQARAAKRYKEISAEIRQAEGLQLHLDWQTAQGDVETAEQTLLEALRVVGLATEAESRTLRDEATAAEVLPGLREDEAKRAAVVHRLKAEDTALEREAARAAERQAELDARMVQLQMDGAREKSLAESAAGSISELARERQAIEAAHQGAVEERDRSAALVERHRKSLDDADAEVATLTARLAEHRATRHRLETMLAEEARRVARCERELAELDLQLRDLPGKEARPDLPALRHRIEEITASLAVHEQQASAAEAAVASARSAVEERRRHATAARLNAQGIATEVATLRRLFVLGDTSKWPPIVDALTVEPGLETALGAALGDDLDAPVDNSAPVHWTTIAVAGADPALPDGVAALGNHVKGPPELKRRLAQVGVVDRADGVRLQQGLEVGQRLVSREGDLWRWDGFIAAADAPTAAAQRLAHRNRLIELVAEDKAAQPVAEAAEAELALALTSHAQAEAHESQLRSSWRRDQLALGDAREAYQRNDRLVRDAEARRLGLAEGRKRSETALADHRERHAALLEEQGALADGAELEAALNEKRSQATLCRKSLADAQSVLAGIERERQHRDQRLQAIAADVQRWTILKEAAVTHSTEIERRLASAREELADLADTPARLAERRAKLLDGLAIAETERSHAADALVHAETRIKVLQRQLREVQTDLAKSREERVRVETRLESAREKRASAARAIREAFECAPDRCLAAVGWEGDSALPSAEDADKRLKRLMQDRERLGGVNLAAEEELAGLETQHRSLERERADLEQAIARLRQAIGKLNGEGRRRLADAFETVNGHFQRLFTTLFSGGEARLEMIESAEDPLEGGLEIIAKPPGKKPATLSLLSGGEQTLTALSLIFAVFLTNPSPICVLDEVDAPLDDANVDRFCTLMEDMARTTATRFLIITHHPMTMSRMNRLYGVTMAEKGISQLVSVDLATAEQYREAG